MDKGGYWGKGVGLGVSYEYISVEFFGGLWSILFVNFLVLYCV